MGESFFRAAWWQLNYTSRASSTTRPFDFAAQRVCKHRHGASRWLPFNDRGGRQGSRVDTLMASLTHHHIVCCGPPNTAS